MRKKENQRERDKNKRKREKETTKEKENKRENQREREKERENQMKIERERERERPKRENQKREKQRRKRMRERAKEKEEERENQNELIDNKIKFWNFLMLSKPIVKQRKSWRPVSQQAVTRVTMRRSVTMPPQTPSSPVDQEGEKNKGYSKYYAPVNILKYCWSEFPFPPGNGI